MSLPPIVIQLSKFEQIEILRTEIEAREEELKNAEKQIRVVLFEVERQGFLQSIHVLFQDLQPPAEAARIQQLTETREALNDAIQTMKNTLAMLEGETAGQSAPASRGLQALRSAGPGAGAGSGSGAAAPVAPKRARFDSFDDFKSSKQGH